tara:strand:- start:350 stop:553 length:204 start_codon:yes stop_codon:yes gene_type:complete
MPWFEMEESYTEHVKGRRLVAVFAETLEDAQNGEISDSDVIKELWQDGQTTDTYLHFETLKDSDYDS